MNITSGLPTIFLVAAALLLVFLLFKIITTPIKWIAKLLIHIALGFVALFVFNFLAGFIRFADLTIPLSGTEGVINAGVAGLLGVPGVILLLVLKLVFHR